MKPLKGILPLSTWLMRIAIMLFVYLAFFDTIKSLQFKSVDFFIALAFGVFSLLLFVGGFVKSQTLTVVSALILLIVSVFEIVDVSKAGLNATLSIFALVASISLYFLAAGNSK